MTSKEERKEQFTELQALLDAWGGEPTRWPPKVRLRIAELSAQGGPARQLVAEARALGRLLDVVEEKPAAGSAARTRALADRIMAAAGAEPGGAAPPVRNAEIIELPRRQAVPARAALKATSAFPAIAGQRWHTAGLLAASLLVGIVVGGSLNVAPVVQEFADAVGLSQTVDNSLTVLGDDLDDEEAL